MQGTSNLFKNVTTLPSSAAVAPVLRYLEAQASQDFGASREFFAEDLQFHGLVLKAEGRAKIASEMEQFIRAALEGLVVEAIAEVESGDRSRFLALYHFITKAHKTPQAICDHITVERGRIARIENVFDVKRLM